MNRKQIWGLSPEAAWKFFNAEGTTVEEFISEFMADGYEKNEIRRMTVRFSQDAPYLLERMCLLEDMDYIADLIEIYMNEYIERKGGIENLKLVTVEELDKSWDESVTELFSLMADRGYQIENERIRKMVEEKKTRKIIEEKKR